MDESTTTLTRRGVPERPPARPRGRPRKLSREGIVTAALALLDREGSDALTMRRLGAELGVEAMSLYRHLASRAELLDGVAALLAAEIERQQRPTHPGTGADWADALRSFAGEIRAVARRHPAAFTLVGIRVLAGPSGLEPLEDVLASLRSGGFTPARAIAAHRLVIAYARGYALSEIAGFAVQAGASDGQPVIRSLSRQLATEPGDGGFRAGLETIIGGLRAERAAAATSP